MGQVNDKLGNTLHTIVPQMTDGGNLSINVNGGAAGVALASQACRQVTIANRSGVDVEAQQDGAGAWFPIMTGAYYTFFGITNADQLRVRRVDQSATAATVSARWES